MRPGPKLAAGFAVQPNRRRSRLEARHALRQQPGDQPASTSPEPAVASQGGALSAIAARPSGAATTVSGPLSSTIGTALAGRPARLLKLCSSLKYLRQAIE